MEDIYFFGFMFFALALGFFSGYLFYQFKQSNNEISYNIVTIKEDIANIQVRLEYLIDIATVKNGQF